MIPPYHLLHYTCGPRVVDPSNEPSPSTTMAFPGGNAPPKAQPTYGFRARSLLPIDRYGYWLFWRRFSRDEFLLWHICST